MSHGRFVDSYGDGASIIIGHCKGTKLHGLYEDYHELSLALHCSYNNGQLHGEYKEFVYDENTGRQYTAEHKVYVNGEVLMSANAPAISRVMIIPGKEKLMLSLKHGIVWLPKERIFNKKAMFLYRITGDLEKALINETT